MADKSGGLAGISGTNVLLAMQIGTEYREITGAGEISYDVPEAPSTTVRAFRRTRRVTGTPDIGNVTVTLPALITNTQVDAALRAAASAGATRQFRVETPFALEFTAAATAMAAIAMGSGEITFSGTGDEADLSEDRFGVGMSIKSGANYYLIDEIPHNFSDSNKASVHPAPSGNVAAATYSIGIETRRWDFNAVVAAYGSIGVSSGEGDALSGSLTLAPVTALPAPTLEGGF